jgi:hypothetical protein
LEIENERGGSTCWSDLFDSDQAALDEALQAIDEDGIRNFIDIENDPASLRALWNVTISQSDIAELRSTLASSDKMISFAGACGVFAAVVSMPDFRAPSEWIEVIKGRSYLCQHRRRATLHRRSDGALQRSRALRD